MKNLLFELLSLTAVLLQVTGRNLQLYQKLTL